jgi:FSR family fosmidomycin resistance protein-like MFS transporter
MVDNGSLAGQRISEDRWNLLTVLSFCHFVNDYYGMMIPPLLPFLARDFQLTYFQSGLLVFMFNIISAFLQPIVGYVADIKMWRKKTMIIGLTLYGVTSVALGLVPNYYLLLVVLFLMGIGGSTYHPQSTSFIAFYFQRLRATASGVHGIGNPLGFLVAPIVVTALIALSGSWRTTAMLMFTPGALAALLIWRAVDEPQQRGSKGFLVSFERGPLLLLTLVSGIVIAVFAGFTTFVPFYSRDAASSIPPGWWLPLTLLPGVVSQPIGGMIADKIGRRNLIILANGALAMALYGFTSSAGGVALSFSMLAGFCLGMVMPVCLIYAAELAVEERVGTAVGILWGFAMGMGALAPLWVGYLRDIFSDFRMAFLSLVIIAAVGTLLSCFLPGRIGSKV